MRVYEARLGALRMRQTLDDRICRTGGFAAMDSSIEGARVLFGSDLKEGDS
jgi:hypothetical protein